jgi:hypothetical protein
MLLIRPSSLELYGLDFYIAEPRNPSRSPCSTMSLLRFSTTIVILRMFRGMAAWLWGYCDSLETVQWLTGYCGSKAKVLGRKLWEYCDFSWLSRFVAWEKARSKFPSLASDTVLWLHPISNMLSLFCSLKPGAKANLGRFLQAPCPNNAPRVL